MATYILLLTLDADGRAQMLEDPDSLRRAEAEIELEEVQCLGLYAVLGDVDFVTILEAPDNEAAARFSLELGVRVDAHIATLPAVPVGLLEAEERHERRDAPTEAPVPAGTNGGPPRHRTRNDRGDR